MGVVFINPETLMQECVKISGAGGHAETFESLINDLYKTIDEMVHYNFVSAGANSLANRIGSERPTLEEMQRTMKAYGDFCGIASNKFTSTDSEISSSFSHKSGNF